MMVATMKSDSVSACYLFIQKNDCSRRPFFDNISTIVVRWQQSMFGHVARLPAADPAHSILSCENPQSWKRRHAPLSKKVSQRGGCLASLKTQSTN